MIKSRKDLEYYLKEDFLSLGLTRQEGIKRFLFQNPIYTFQRTLRYLEYYTNCKSVFRYPIWIYYKLKFRRLSLKLGFSIPINVIAEGLSIAHYGTIIISPNAKIGKNCRIHACVNIGASAGDTHAPQIGDNVYIGPGSLIFGDISISDNVTIAANATVCKSCAQSNVVLAGVPANIIKTNYPNWISFNHRNR